MYKKLKNWKEYSNPIHVLETVKTNLSSPDSAEWRLEKILPSISGCIYIFEYCSYKS